MASRFDIASGKIPDKKPDKKVEKSEKKTETVRPPLPSSFSSLGEVNRNGRLYSYSSEALRDLESVHGIQDGGFLEGLRRGGSTLQMGATAMRDQTSSYTQFRQDMATPISRTTPLISLVNISTGRNIMVDDYRLISTSGHDHRVTVDLSLNLTQEQAREFFND